MHCLFVFCFVLFVRVFAIPSSVIPVPFCAATKCSS
jgi:hypothetical protein